MVASIESLPGKERKNKRLLGERQDPPRGNGQCLPSRIDRIAVVSLSGRRRTLREFGGSPLLLAIFLRNQSAVAMRSLTEQAGAEPAACSTRSATGRTPNGKHSFDFELSLGCKAFSFEAGHGARVTQNVG